MDREHPFYSVRYGRIALRLISPLLCIAGLCLLVVCFYDFGHTALPPTEKRYLAAKEGGERLRLDKDRSSYREPWEQLITEFKAIYDSDPAWPNRPAALFRAAETLEELSRRSYDKKDAIRAAECFEQVALKHSDSRLADDALFRAAQIRAAWLKDEKGAVNLINRLKQQYPNGDMYSRALALEKTLVAAASGKTSPDAANVAQRALIAQVEEEMPTKGLSEVEAQMSYKKLKERMEALANDPNRKCQRHPWEQLRDDFLGLSAETENLVYSSAAVFKAAQSQEALAKCANLSGEYRKAVNIYLHLAKNMPNSVLADDSLLAAAKIQSESLDNQKAALDILERQLKSYPRGDMRQEALKLQNRLLATMDKGVDPQNMLVPKITSVADAKKQVPEIQKLAWDSLNTNSVQIVLELSRPAQYKAKLIKATNKQPASIVLDFDDADAVRDVKRGVSIRGSLLQAVRSHDNKKGLTLQFDFRNVKRYEVKDIADPPAIIISVATANAPLPKTDKIYAATDIEIQKSNKAKDASKDAPKIEVAQAKTETKQAKSEEVKAKATKAENLKPETKPESKPEIKSDTKLAQKEAKSDKSDKVAKADLNKINQGKTKDKELANKDKALANNELNDKINVANDRFADKSQRSLRQKVVPAGRTNLIDQLGLSMQRVVIDAGHGGRDPGAVRNHVYERDITIDVSLRLGQILARHGLEVIYTRTTDRTISLSERTNRANIDRADLFVSIHVNAHPTDITHGFETYYLDMASNSQAARVAALENARSDRRIGDLQDILADVMLFAKQEESRRLANDIHTHTINTLRKQGQKVNDNGVRSAPFHVLLGANMPAVLVELGYCSNVREAKKLSDPQYRQYLADGLAKGILAYRDRLSKRMSVEKVLTDDASSAMYSPRK